jgi:hypothetical protein
MFLISHIFQLYVWGGIYMPQSKLAIAKSWNVLCIYALNMSRDSSIRLLTQFEH